METWIQNCLHRVQWTFHPHREPGPQEKYHPATSKTSSKNPQSSSGILILSSAEVATILIILLIYQLYSLWIPPKQYHLKINNKTFALMYHH